MKKKIITIFFIMLLPSCLAITDPLFSDIPSANNFVNRFPQNQKSIVILKLRSDNLSTNWCQASLLEEVKNKHCFKINPSNYYQILMVEPGLYEIEGYKIANRRYQNVQEKEIASSISNISGKRRAPPMLAFEALEGRISFLGEIIFHHISTSGIAIKDDNFELIKSIFINNNEAQMRQFIKGHEWEAHEIAKQNIAQIFVKNLAKTRSDFTEEKQIERKIEKQQKRESKKSSKHLIDKKKLRHKLLNYEN